ncbi:MAG: OmpA family protein [Candidatus Omnitrophica bacterium]|nr:OmpA family protein [Candidatus Omnitrophota bacterium]
MKKFNFFIIVGLITGLASFSTPSASLASDQDQVSGRPTIANMQVRKQKRAKELETVSENLSWWPTDAKPGAVKDDERSGYWWYPTTPGQIEPWGNRGYIYVYKIIFDYQSDDLPAPKQEELRPSLLLRRVIKDVRVYFDYNKSELRADAIEILRSGVRALQKNPQASVLITGHADQRGSQEYNLVLAKSRASSVQKYFEMNGITKDRIKIISRGKLDAIANTRDLEGLQRDRNAHFVVAEVEEVMLPYQGPPQDIQTVQINDNTYLTQSKESLESDIQVSTREYVVKKGDTLTHIAKAELGNPNRWTFLYEFNRERIKDPNKLQPGQKILIPVE